jgi:rRNA maturation protein Nop10
MRKCPRCNQYGETDTIRFCNSCGTELFFSERFDGKNRFAKKFHGSIQRMIERFFTMLKNLLTKKGNNKL